jgi:hypothetical protein
MRDLVAIERLMKEYHTHKKLIVAVDFDDTVYDFHNAGYSYHRVLNVVRDAQALGFFIVVFTGSHPDSWPMQRTYLAERGIKVDSINENPLPLPFGNHGKIYYNILLDDRAGLGQAVLTLETVIRYIQMEKKDEQE